MRLIDKGIPKLVTTTTRAPRPGEVEGHDYYYRDMSAFNSKDFVEYTVYHGNYYGLSKAEINQKLERADVVQLSMDKKGVAAMKEQYPEETVVVFLKISKEEMTKRMRERGDSPEQIAERVQHSRQEEEYIAPAEADLILINENIDETVDQIMTYLQNKE